MTDPTPVPPAPQPAQPVQPAPAAPLPAESGTFRPEDLVYVDPDTKTVVGRVEYSRNGNPKSMPVKQAPPPVGKAKDDERRRGRKYYPWGTYKSLKNVFKLEGKQKKAENTLTLNDILPIALEQPFWDPPVTKEEPKNEI